MRSYAATRAGQSLGDTGQASVSPDHDRDCLAFERLVGPE